MENKRKIILLFEIQDTCSMGFRWGVSQAAHWLKAQILQQAAQILVPTGHLRILLKCRNKFGGWREGLRFDISNSSG